MERQKKNKKTNIGTEQIINAEQTGDKEQTGNEEQTGNKEQTSNKEQTGSKEQEGNEEQTMGTETIRNTPQEMNTKLARNAEQIRIAEDTESRQKIHDIMEKESMAVQKSNWILQQIEGQRKVEDELRLKMAEEQKLLEERSRSIEEGMQRNLQLRRYNEQRREELDAQVYGFYGISEDKRDGMKQYRVALFKGCAVILFVLSFAMTFVSAYLYGPLEKITIAMAGCVAAEGALMPGRGKRSTFLQGICNVLYIAVFPGMIYLFVGYEFQFLEYDWILLGVISAVMLFSLIGCLSYFVYNPYKNDKYGIRQAKKELKHLHKKAEKQVQKNQKIRRKEEKEAEKAARREEEREKKKRSREKKRELRRERALKRKEEAGKRKQEKKTFGSKKVQLIMPGGETESEIEKEPEVIAAMKLQDPETTDLEVTTEETAKEKTQDKENNMSEQKAEETPEVKQQKEETSVSVRGLEKTSDIKQMEETSEPEQKAQEASEEQQSRGNTEPEPELEDDLGLKNERESELEDADPDAVIKPDELTAYDGQEAAEFAKINASGSKLRKWRLIK